MTTALRRCFGLDKAQRPLPTPHVSVADTTVSNQKTRKTKRSQTYIALHVQCNIDMQTSLTRGIKEYILDITT